MDAAIPTSRRRRPFANLFKHIRSLRFTSGFALVFIIFLAVCMAFPDLVAPYDPASQDVRARLHPPAWNATGDWSHPLGTDNLGRDVFSRLVYGSRVTLGIAISAAAFEAIIGVTLGLIAGYLGGRIDRFITAWTDIQMGFPAILLLMVIILTLGNAIPMLVFAIAINGWMIFARVIRTRVRTLKEQPFVEAAIASGSGKAHVIRRHLLPHLRVDILALMILEVARIILAESGISFLGVGVQPPNISWGSMLGTGRNYMAVAYHLAAFAGLAISASVIAFNVFATWLEPILDPTRAGSGRSASKHFRAMAMSLGTEAPAVVAVLEAEEARDSALSDLPEGRDE